MITWRSFRWVVRKEVGGRDRRMIYCVHVSDQEIKYLITMGTVVDKLAELGGKKQDVVRLVAVEVAKEEKLGIRILHLQKVIVH